MDHPVHPLGCRWTDVVFFSPVHPALIFDALRDVLHRGPVPVASLRTPAGTPVRG
jgi:hypothetical protein